MDGEKLERLVLAAATEVDGRPTLSCAEAFALADAHGVELLEIARICNEKKIKFVRCQLGCFA